MFTIFVTDFAFGLPLKSNALILLHPFVTKKKGASSRLLLEISSSPSGQIFDIWSFL